MINSLVRESQVVTSVPEDYGIDFGGPIPEEQPGTVEIPDTLSPVHDAHLQDFLDFVDTDTFFEDNAMEHYIDCKQYLINML